jgi:hypothetical protein
MCEFGPYYFNEWFERGNMVVIEKQAMQTRTLESNYIINVIQAVVREVERFQLGPISTAKWLYSLKAVGVKVEIL